jgi:hypothetical protein
MTDEQAALAKIIAGVTDLWDEPLDEVHDIPQIVNAILASPWLADLRNYAHHEGFGSGVEWADQPRTRPGKTGGDDA